MINVNNPSAAISSSIAFFFVFSKIRSVCREKSPLGMRAILLTNFYGYFNDVNVVGPSFL